MLARSPVLKDKMSLNKRDHNFDSLINGDGHMMEGQGHKFNSNDKNDQIQARNILEINNISSPTTGNQDIAKREIDSGQNVLTWKMSPDKSQQRNSTEIYQQKKDYWKEYQEKYGKMGIIADVEKTDENCADWIEQKTAEEHYSVANQSSNDLPRGYINKETLKCKSDGRPEDECTRTNDPLSKYSKKRAARSHSGRRSHSDLGFTIAHRTSIPTPRTVAILANPALKKHLARVMGLDEDKIGVNDFSLDFQNRMSTTSGSLDKSKKKENKENLSGSKLRNSFSDSNIGSHCKDVIPVPIGSSISQSDQDIHRSSQSTERKSSLVPHLDLTGISHSPRSPGAESKSPTKSQRSNFAIPSFHEFKQLRKQQSGFTSRIPGSSSFSYDFMKENTIEEEKESDVMDVAINQTKVKNVGQGELEKYVNLDDTGHKDNSVNIELNSHSKVIVSKGIPSKATKMTDDVTRNLSKCKFDPDDLIELENTGRVQSHDLRGHHRKENRRRCLSENSGETEVQGHPEVKERRVISDVPNSGESIKIKTTQTMTELDHGAMISNKIKQFSDAIPISGSKPPKPSRVRNARKTEDCNGAYNVRTSWPKTEFKSKPGKPKSENILSKLKKDNSPSIKDIIQKFESGHEVNESSTDLSEVEYPIKRSDSQRSSQKLRRSEAFLIKRRIISDDETDNAAMDAKLKTSPRNHDNQEPVTCDEKRWSGDHHLSPHDPSSNQSASRSKSLAGSRTSLDYLVSKIQKHV